MMTSRKAELRLAVSIFAALGAAVGTTTPALAATRTTVPAPAVVKAGSQTAPPTAAFTLSATSATVPGNGDSVTIGVDASASASADGSILLSYDVDCQNGFTVNGDSPHLGCFYTQPGTYQVSLTVTDVHGVTATSAPQTVTITLTPPGPPVIPGFWTGPYVNTTQTAWVDLSQITFDFRADPSKVTFVVTWGDGSTDTYNNDTRNPPSKLHRYAAGGTYLVSVTVNDGMGLPTSVASASQDVTVQPDPA